MASNSLLTRNRKDQYAHTSFSLHEMKEELKGMIHPAHTYEDGDEIITFNSSDRNNPPITIKDIHINCFSDIFDPTKNYVGFIVYLCEKKNDFKLGGIHCKTGDIFIKQSDWIQRQVRERSKRGKYLHGRIFYSVFGRWKKKKLEFIGGGFSYYKGRWKFNSRTFNTMNSGNNDDTYHDKDKQLEKTEKKLLENVISRLYENHHWLEMSMERRVSLKELHEMKSLAKKVVNNDLILSRTHKDRRFHGMIISFNNQRGYGFIQCHGIHHNIFVHSSEVQCCPSNQHYFINGIDVEFSIINTNKGWKAISLTRFVFYS